MNPTTNDALPCVDPKDPTLTEILDDLFTYHAPTEVQVDHYNAINAASKELAAAILLNCPNCPDRSHALRVVRDARMWANASIATRTGGVIPRTWTNDRK